MSIELARDALSARPGRYVLREWVAPRGPLKRDYISLREADGRELEEVPISIFEQLIRSGVIRQVGPDDYERGTVYRPARKRIG